MERPGLSIRGALPVYAFAASEGAVWGTAAGLLASGSIAVGIGVGTFGAFLGLVLARWYLPRRRAAD